MTTPEAPLPRNLSDILCFIWNIGWLILFATITAIIWYHWPKEYVADWPDGSPGDRNCWHSEVFDGVFRDHTADRIRRIATYHGDEIDRHSPIAVFASIPSTGYELDQILNSWNFRERNHGSEIHFHPKRPDWFPLLKYHMGTIEENGETWNLFVRPGDHHLYISR